ncbi:MAG TPA: LamG domain-containing protein [Candidatus Sulfotelmatobacter sp.]|nr:LamG domain-containing protein [Candidatus Sulfotelmatobacter sp.]
MKTPNTIINNNKAFGKFNRWAGLLGGIMALLCSSMASAQIIYSNNFSLGAAVNISNTPPTYAASYAGGSSSAVWLDVAGSATTHGPLLANGIVDSGPDDFWALPFKPQTNHVYLLTVVLTFTNNPGVAAEFGYSINTTLTNYSGDPRFNGSVNGYDWMAPNFSGNPEFFAGNKTANTLLSANNVFPAGVGTNTFQIILDTRGGAGGTNWVAAGCVNGVGVNGTYTYSPTLYAQVTNITTVGISQNGTASVPTAAQYQSFVLETTLKPFIVRQPVASSIASGNSTWTNSVTVLADTNGGSLSYQWYANGAPLENGVNGVSGANTNVLTISPITPANAFTNYYAIVNNNYGSATSTLASVTVLTNPVVTLPATPSNSIDLFGGSGGNFGSSPTFSVSASGAPSLDYRWYTNGVEIGTPTLNASSSSISFTDLQAATAPTNFSCVVSNAFGTVTNTWYPTYLAAPTAAYPQAVLGDLPFNFWRLNESDNGSGNEGSVSHDYGSGDNGVYTNTDLSETGYNSSETAETAALFGVYASQYSYDGRIHGVDFAAASGSNAEFTVEAWAQGFADDQGSPVATEGTFNVNDEFGLGSSTNPTTLYQFYVRAANGTVYKAVSSIPVNDFTWHYLAGVCDQANSVITLYVDGKVAATTTIPAGSGIIEASAPFTIGANIASGQPDYGTYSTNQWTGYVDDVATYKYALSPAQVVNHYSAVPGNFVPVTFISPQPLPTFSYLANQTLTIPITAAASGPIGYYWTNVTVGGIVASGTTNVSGALNATLTIPNASAGLNGDQLELVVTNSGSSTNLFVTLYNPPAPITVSYSSSVLYSNDFLSNYSGGGWSINGMEPTVENVLVGAPDSVWIDALGTNDIGVLQANGTVTSTLQDSWTLPFTPQAGYIYTLSATETFLGAPSSWVALGFCQGLVTNGTVGGTARINGGTGSVNGVDWILWQQNGSEQYFATGTANLAGTNTAAVGNVSHAVSVVLNTTGTVWTCYSTIDGHTNSSGSFSPTNASIVGVTISQNSTGTANTNIVWNTFMLTQTAPGGVAPYLMAPLPPTSPITLTNQTVALNATVFGSAPMGYYWINNSTVLESGVTNTPNPVTPNNAAPISANLSVPASSLSVGTLDLVATNAYGTNITSIALVNPVNTNSVPINFAETNGNLYLSWPFDHTGWTLQAQTNSVTVGISTNWVTVTGSTATNVVVVPITLTNGTVFYRLIYP